MLPPVLETRDYLFVFFVSQSVTLLQPLRKLKNGPAKGALQKSAYDGTGVAPGTENAMRL